MIEQLTMFGEGDIPCLRTSRDFSVPTTEKTSGSSWKKLQGSQTQPLLFLDLRIKDDGQARESSSGTVFRWPGGSTTAVGGASRRDGEGSASSQTSTDTQPPRYCSIVNWGEKPMVPVETKLSDILETNPDPKYNLSPKACQGILNRAARRGKELPEMLKAALKRQAKAIPSETTTTDGLSGSSPCASTRQPEGTDSRISSEGDNAVAVYDARGNGDGGTVPTITGDHQNRVTDYTAVCCGSRSPDIAGALDDSYYKGCGARNGEERTVVADERPKGGDEVSAVRRLTPLQP